MKNSEAAWRFRYLRLRGKCMKQHKLEGKTVWTPTSRSTLKLSRWSWGNVIQRRGCFCPLRTLVQDVKFKLKNLGLRLSDDLLWCRKDYLKEERVWRNQLKNIKIEEISTW